MAKGTVKDPTGHQSKSYDFGYIKRSKLKWPKLNRFKVIPFLNKPAIPGDDNSRPYALGQPFDFDVVEAEVHYNGEYQGTIGIAVKK